MALITTDQALLQIRGGDEIDEDELQEVVDAACAMVLNYLKSASPYVAELDSAGDPVVDSNGDPVYTTTVRPEVQHATKMLVGYLWRNRDENADDAFDRGYLPKPVTAILYPLRSPALA
jgi:hypothetical protein